MVGLELAAGRVGSFDLQLEVPAGATFLGSLSSFFFITGT